MLVVFLLSFLIPNLFGQPCDDAVSIELSNKGRFSDGTIVHEGITFPPKYVYTKEVDGENKTFGCVCEIRKCISKCCKPGHVFVGKNCTEIPEYDIVLREEMQLHYLNGFRKNVLLNTSDFFMLYRKPCVAMFHEDDVPGFLQENGDFYMEMKNVVPADHILGPDKYCIDTFVTANPDGSNGTELNALVCFPKDQETNMYKLSSSCMLISCVFILATVAVYAWLPELRNLHGRVLMAYLLCLFVGFLFLSIMQILLMDDNINFKYCVILTFIIYYSLLAAFFWLNVMCFDIWWTFSGKRGMSLGKMSIRARFCAYALYAFGIPTALTIILAGLEFSGLPPHPLLPMLGRQGCFLAGKSKMLYFYGPIVILCVANILFFILTALKITQIKQQTSVLKSKESATHDQQNSDKQRLLLYAKLFVVMGLSWLLEVASFLYDHPAWRYTDAYNVLIGLIIFIIFVCKRKIFQLIKKRYKQVIKGTPISRSQTWSRTLSSKDEVTLTSVSNK